MSRSTLGGKATVAANRAGLRQRGRVEPVPELSLSMVYNMSIENKREIEELKDRVNELEEELETMKDLQAGTVTQLERQNLHPLKHASIPHSKLKFTNDGALLPWWDLLAFKDMPLKKDKDKTQIKCTAPDCLVATTFICRCCSTTTRLVPVCRPLDEKNPKHACAITRRRARTTPGGELNYCWNYHIRCDLYKSTPTHQAFMTADADDDDDE